MSKLRRTFKQKFDEKAQAPRIFSGLLGNGFGKVDAGEGKAYVRIAGSVNTAVCSGVPYVNNLPVWVGYTPDFPNTLRVLGQQSTKASEFIDGVGKHGNQHEWMGAGVGGGTDVVKVHLQQFVPLMVLPYSGLRVQVYPGIAWTGTEYKLIADTNSQGKPIPTIIDLTNYFPSTDKEKYVLIGIDTDGEIEVVDGIVEKDEGGTMIYKLAAVRRYDSQIEIVVNREVVDIVDLRFPIWRALSYDEIVGELDWSDIDMTGSNLSDLETKLFTDLNMTGSSIADLEKHSHTLLTDIGTNTHDQIDTFIAGHTHVEDDITNLDHNAQKIKGIPLNLSGLSDGDGIIYDQGADEWIPGASSGGGGGGTSGDWLEFIDGALVVETGVGGTYIVPRDSTIEAVMIHCKDQGSTGSTIVDVNLNGTTIFTTQSGRPELAYDDVDGVATSGTPDVVTLVAGDILTIDIDQIATGAESLSVLVAMHTTITLGSMSNLSDVDLTGIVDGNVLVYDETNSKFIAGEGGGTGGADILEVQVFM
jgi:hypothetical protein